MIIIFCFLTNEEKTIFSLFYFIKNVLYLHKILFRWIHKNFKIQ